MARKKTNKEFLREVEELVGNEYSILSKYINSKTHVKIRHNTCGHVYKVIPANFLYGKRCPVCMRKQSDKSRRKTNEQFLDEVNELVGQEYKVLDKYKTAVKKIRFKHNKCGHVFKMSPNAFLTGSRCPKCGWNNFVNSNKFTQEEFKELLKEKTNNECIALDEYVNSQTPIRFKHLLCGNIFTTKPSHVLAGHYCKSCGNKKIGNKLRKTHEEYVEEVFRLVGDEYKILSKYKRDNEEVKIKHLECGRTYQQRAGNILQGIGCPHCKESKGERRIYDFLKKHRIEHEREYRDERCRNVYPLPFDFAIFKKRKLKCLIEYDGELHYKPARWNNSLEKLKAIQKTDKIKSEFCKKEGIPLITIPYWDYENIESILKKRFKQLSIL